MKSSRVLIGAACAACFAMACSTVVIAAAGPSTRPASTKPAATKPAAKPAPKLDKSNSTQFESSLTKVKFRVPKAWTCKQSSPGGTDERFVFDAAPADAGPHRKARPNGTGRPPAYRWLSVYFAEPCEATKKLDVLIESSRALQRQQNPNVQFVVDEPADFGGRSGWTLAWDEMKEITYFELRNGKDVQRTEKVPYRTTLSYFYEGGFLCQFQSDSVVADAELMRRHAASVVASFEAHKE